MTLDIHNFTTAGSHNVTSPTGTTAVEVIVQSGGACGNAGTSTLCGGGGGAGGMSNSRFPIGENVDFTVIVGDGGKFATSPDQNSGVDGGISQVDCGNITYSGQQYSTFTAADAGKGGTQTAGGLGGQPTNSINIPSDMDTALAYGPVAWHGGSGSAPGGVKGGGGGGAPEMTSPYAGIDAYGYTGGYEGGGNGGNGTTGSLSQPGSEAGAGGGGGKKGTKPSTRVPGDGKEGFVTITFYIP